MLERSWRGVETLVWSRARARGDVPRRRLWTSEPGGQLEVAAADPRSGLYTALVWA